MKSVINILENASGVTALLNNGADSIFMQREPQKEAPPYIVIMSEIVDTNSTYSGENLDEWNVSVHVVSDRVYTSNSVNGCWDIAQQVRSAMVGSTGTYDGENYNVTQMVSESTFFEDDVNIPRVETEQEYQIFSTR